MIHTILIKQSLFSKNEKDIIGKVAFKMSLEER